MIGLVDIYCIITPSATTQSLLNMNTPSQTAALNIHMADGGQDPSHGRWLMRKKVL